jgi:hypothetical protein
MLAISPALAGSNDNGNGNGNGNVGSNAGSAASGFGTVTGGRMTAQCF